MKMTHSASGFRHVFECVLVVLCLTTLAAGACLSGTITTVQSIPLDLVSPGFNYISTYESWLQIINSAQQSIDIACYYMTLTEGMESGVPPGQGGYMGMNIFDALVKAARERGVRIRIVQQLPDSRMPDTDTRQLTALGAATVRSIDFSTLMGGKGGILHTKMIVVDGQAGYVGSANLDWRSLSQVKEIGITVINCPEYAQDLEKVFEEYWIAAAGTVLPSWPSSLFTTFNDKTPMVVGLKNTSVFISSGPAPFAPSGRVNDLDAILGAINRAKSFLTFSVMDYTPTSMYVSPAFYWPPIDDALRAAALKGVNVQLLFSIWNHTNSRELPYWNSLNDINNISVRVIKIPDSPYAPPAPFTRVSHSKYIVSDQGAYVTTSNCGADYYLSTGGVSVNFMDATSDAYHTLLSVFMGDFNGPYSSPVPPYLPRRPQN